MNRKCAIVLGIAVVNIIFLTLTSAATAKEATPPYVANFSYTPDAHRAPGSGGVTMAMGSLSYVTRGVTPWFKAPQFAGLEPAIKDDIAKILSSKGFAVRGPFDNYDLIPYGEKKAIDLYVIPSLEVSVTSKGPMEQGLPPGAIAKVVISGKLNLEMREIITRELMWSKSIPIKPTDFTRSGSIKWEVGVRVADVDTLTDKPVDLDADTLNTMAQWLEAQYPEIMSTMASLIDPQEMRVIKRQALELKRKKGY